MFRKFHRLIRTTAIFGVVFAVALSFAWATINTYSASMTIYKTEAGAMGIVNDGPNKITAYTEDEAVDAYLDEYELNQIEITADLTEEWVDTGNGTGYYRLSFTFSPSGLYFSPPLYLKIKGKWVADDTQFWLYDENGEELEGIRHNNGNQIIFEIDHFSCYYYESYCY